MPEGPFILHLADQLKPFKGKPVKKAGGYGDMPTAWIKGKKLLDIKTFGKNLLLVFTNGVVRIHLGLFGDVIINERKKVNRSFFLEFTHGEINGYVVKASKMDEPLNKIYDWRIDILSKKFDPAFVKKRIMGKSEHTIADLLVDQSIFAGSGNIIRNEALYRAGIHPRSIAGKIPAVKISKLVRETVIYAKIFYRKLKTSGENDLYQVYQQEHAADGSQVTMEVLQKTKRKVFYSEHRQKLFV